MTHSCVWHDVVQSFSIISEKNSTRGMTRLAPRLVDNIFNAVKPLRRSSDRMYSGRWYEENAFCHTFLHTHTHAHAHTHSFFISRSLSVARARSLSLSCSLSLSLSLACMLSLSLSLSLSPSFSLAVSLSLSIVRCLFLSFSLSLSPHPPLHTHLREAVKPLKRSSARMYSGCWYEENTFCHSL